jgi:ABC-type multidrug transport system ATPase subunit
MNVLEIRDIRKSYGAIEALKGVSFNVPQGSVFGILGPNGSGKTTLLGILLDVLKANSGDYQWVGYTTAQEARQHIGALLETPNFYHYLSPVKNLKISATIKGRGENDIDNVLQRVNLFNRKDSAFSTFSLGMKQRLAIASSLLGKPKILVFDEPTNGLDPVGISEIRNLIKELNQEGFTIIMASHLLDEVEKVCTHVAILKTGQLITSGSVLEVLNDNDWIELGAKDMNKLEKVMHDFSHTKELKRDQYLMLSTKEDIGLDQVNQYCFEQGITLQHLLKRKRSLESKFMEMTQ